VMHSVNAPSVEANTLYVEQSCLESRLLDTSKGGLVIWDVGLGAASNAMAALSCFERTWQEQQGAIR
jgi:queuine tRNA-ribosyltransferase